MKTFLGIGECMLELSLVGPATWHQSFAGDVFNTLWYARSALGSDWDVAFYTGVGDDPISDELKKFANDVGISMDQIPTIPGKVPGLYMIHLDGAERSFSYWRDTSAARQMLADKGAFWDKIAQSDLIYLSGITLAILPHEDLATLLDGLRSHAKPDAVIAFDPNIRPRLWDDLDRARQAISDAAAISDIVLPSFDDEESFFGDASPEATAQRYLALGTKMVVVKNGPQDTMVARGDDRESFPVPTAANPVDTTAAGDSFAGAFMAEWMTSRDAGKAVRAAQACAAKVVCTKGALVPFDQLR